MSRRSSRSNSAALVLLAMLVVPVVLAGLPRAAFAQACCAGSGAVTPGRLAMHEDALAAVQLKADHVFGSFDSRGHYATPPSGTAEQNFEQDLIGAYRVPFLDRLQIALQVPLVENRRSSRGNAKVGAGIGDINVAGRYDVVYAGMYRYLPGIAALVGVTFPTGRTPEDANDKQLATDATGIGAFQGSVGVNVEQIFGNWLVSVYGIVAKRASRTANGVSTTLGTQWTALAAVAYTLPHDYAVAASLSYTGEGDAEVAGVDADNSARRIPIVGLSGVAPLSDHFRFQGALSLNPPIPSLGKNQPANLGLSITGLYAWY